MSPGIIAVGTSAGGIEILSRILPCIPNESKSTVLIVQHLSADSDSSFLRMMNKICRVRVKEACATEELKPGIVYFAPPDYHLLVESDGTFSLSSDEKVNYSRPSIDLLFETAAEAFGKNVTGILMTGANRDGSRGLQRIQQLGGKTIVQESSDAQFPEMPSSALKLIKPDKILSVKELLEFFSKI
jgi:two-component system chemotaxis response regulator CheB